VDDEVYSQPLVVGNLAIASGTHNVVFIATVNNSIYAYDGDDGTLYWKKNYTSPGMRPPNWTDMASDWCRPYTNFTSNIGIVGTPVIDTVSQTIYFVTRSTDGNNFIQHLHAVNINNGNEQTGSPVVITASLPGTGDGSINNIVSFDPKRNNQRQGLALVNGVVYIAYSSHCDLNPYHGWILGYNASTLQQTIAYNDTPDGEGGGIWQSGMGLVADAQGNLYVTTGNGTVGQGNLFNPSGNGTSENNPNPNPSDLRDRSESALKLSPSSSTLQVSSFFTPSDYFNLNINDLDYGVMGSMLIPNTNYYFTGTKSGNLYLLNKDNMGGYSSTNQVQQTISINASFHCQPAYFKGSSKEYVYVWSENDKLRALSFNRNSNTFDNTEVVATEKGPIGQSGAVLSVSSNGTTDSTGIVWAAYAISTDASGVKGPGILRAFEADDITKEIWNSNLDPNDHPGNYAKFSSPTIANGHVYLATFSNQVVVYGLK
jgi:outer membrane protein assembly factor BamB